MNAVHHIDELVKEYLLFRGFSNTFRAFEQESRNDRDKGFQADKIVEELYSFIINSDINGLIDYWRYLDVRYFSRLDGRFLGAVNKFELCLLRYYLVYAAQQKRKEKILEFFDTAGPELSSNPEWTKWFGLPFSKNPATDPNFETFFTKQWLETFTVSLRNFLNTIFQNMPLPALLCFNIDRLQIRAMQTEIETLQSVIENLKTEIDTGGDMEVTTSTKKKTRSDASTASKSRRRAVSMQEGKERESSLVERLSRGNNSTHSITSKSLHDGDASRSLFDLDRSGTPISDHASVDEAVLEGPYEEIADAGETTQKFVAINWNSSGGGAFAVIPHRNAGKIVDGIPLYRGHTAAVLDTDFANFNDNVIASCAEDSKVMIWNIPDELGEPESPDVTPAATLSGHTKKVGHVLFHPVADNILASSSSDLSIYLWDLTSTSHALTLRGFTDLIHSLSYSYNGNLLATTSRDKKLRIFDVRSTEVVQQADSHQGIKGSRVVWLGDADRLVTTGFSKMSDRQVYVWDTRALNKPMKTVHLDTSSGVVMPFYDNDTKMLYLAGKVVFWMRFGDGTIRYYEFENDALYFLSTYQSPEPQRGLAFMPKRALNINECEIARAYKVMSHMIEPISFVVPRKSDAFQSDIFPETPSDEPSLTAEEFFSGKSANPKLVNLENGFTPKPKKEFVSSAPPEEKKEEPPVLKTEELQEAYNNLLQKNTDLQKLLDERDAKIASLTAELERLKSD
ncbi:2863_t:CDS:10 [Paraglomus brasilianum]|uniref:Coronin n=1 Tax=Paraglomus brasilianum TaxID=144538 RepID=A0A9N8WI09_9GLOM|nr:2863_t:CDS:10 [Paraglomus brasilianum]